VFQFFNLDNVFATALFGATVWMVIHAAFIQEDLFHTAVVMLGVPSAGYFITFCGMPAKFAPSEHYPQKVLRLKENLYELYHTIWHIISGAGEYPGEILFVFYVAPGCFVCARYFSLHGQELGVGYFDSAQRIPLVPTLCVAIAIAINLLGNYIGVMPLD
jgi:hypothetical protein